jgi:hypothetical protein
MFWNPPVLMIIGSNRLNYKLFIAPGQARSEPRSASSGQVDKSLQIFIIIRKQSASAIRRPGQYFTTGVLQLYEQKDFENNNTLMCNRGTYAFCFLFEGYTRALHQNGDQQRR